MVQEKRSRLRVLTLDGGGIRGLYSASILLNLAGLFNSPDKQAQFDIGKSFNLICGTSTGAILACALAAGVPLNKIIDLYIKHGKAVFPNPTPDGSKLFLWILQHLHKPSANHRVLKSALDDVFGDKTLKEVYEERHIGLCIPTVDANNGKALVFKTPHSPVPNKGKRDISQTLVNICMASAAAPIMMPVHQYTDPNDSERKHSYIDGGLWANTPVLVGLIEALEISSRRQPIDLLSVGTCEKPNGDPSDLIKPNWGIFKWKAGIKTVEMSLSAQAFGYQHMARLLANAMSDLGKEIAIERLEATQKSPEQFSAIAIDKADKKAIDTLKNLASEDAQVIHSKAVDTKNNEYAILKEIFTNLTLLDRERSN